jgi:nicotinamide riboside kinase
MRPLRVVVTGSECTGKTSLATAMARHYDAPLVSEYARCFVRDVGRSPEAGDVETIARGQLRAEAQCLLAAHDLIVLDTDLLSTVIYSHHYYGECPAWIEDECARRVPDLYLLAGTHVPWVPDGAQRDRGSRRGEMQDLFQEALRARGARFAHVDGPPRDRLRQANGSVGALRRLARG